MEYRLGSELKEFNRLYKEFDELYHGIAVRAELSDSAFCILYAVVEMGDGCLQKEISERYFFSKQIINSSIQNLKSKGYILLTQGKGHDKHIHLTETGEQLVKEKILPVMDMENAAFSQMPQKESQELLRLTKKYMQLLQKKFQENR